MKRMLLVVVTLLFLLPGSGWALDTDTRVVSPVSLKKREDLLERKPFSLATDDFPFLLRPGYGGYFRGGTLRGCENILYQPEVPVVHGVRRR